MSHSYQYQLFVPVMTIFLSITYECRQMVISVVKKLYEQINKFDH